MTSRQRQFSLKKNNPLGSNCSFSYESKQMAIAVCEWLGRRRRRRGGGYRDRDIICCMLCSCAVMAFFLPLFSSPYLDPSIFCSLVSDNYRQVASFHSGGLRSEGGTETGCLCLKQTHTQTHTHTHTHTHTARVCLQVEYSGCEGAFPTRHKAC